MAHTPGPWRIDLNRYGVNGAWVRSVKTDATVVRMVMKADRPYQVKEADIALIAAAPDLLDALKVCSFALGKLVAASGSFTEEYATILDQATAALQKAGGQ